MSEVTKDATDDDLLGMPKSAWTAVVLWLKPTGELVEPIFFTMTVWAKDSNEAALVAFEVVMQEEGADQDSVCVGPVFAGDLSPEEETVVEAMGLEGVLH